MDTIFIENLTYTGIHGVYKKEHHIPQRFTIDVRMDVTTTDTSSRSDDVSHTVDYTKTRDIVKNIIEGTHCNLVEKIAHDIASSILEDKRIESCEVTIKKPDAFDVGTPGVTIRRTQCSQSPKLLKPVSSKDLKELIQSIQKTGVGILPLISQELCKTIEQEACAYPFIKAETYYGKNNVEQNFTYFRDYPRSSMLWTIGGELEEVLNNASADGHKLFSSPLSFTEISSQHYGVTDIGISPHKDESIYKNIIAVCVIKGEGEFYTQSTREGGTETVIPASIGDVIFMRAPGFYDNDERPIHAVRKVTSERLSVTFRDERR